VEDPVQIFEECVDALNRVDREAMVRLVDPEIVFIPLRAGVSGPYIGIAGMHTFLDENDDLYEYFRCDLEQVEPLPDGRLLALGWIRVRGRGGENELVVRTAGIAAFRDGRMLSWHDYGSDAAARERI
jgi:hypothetical protein